MVLSQTSTLARLKLFSTLIHCSASRDPHSKKIGRLTVLACAIKIFHISLIMITRRFCVEDPSYFTLLHRELCQFNAIITRIFTCRNRYTHLIFDNLSHGSHEFIVRTLVIIILPSQNMSHY